MWVHPNENWTHACDAASECSTPANTPVKFLPLVLYRSECRLPMMWLCSTGFNKSAGKYIRCNKRFTEATNTETSCTFHEIGLFDKCVHRANNLSICVRCRQSLSLCAMLCRGVLFILVRFVVQDRARSLVELLQEVSLCFMNASGYPREHTRCTTLATYLYADNWMRASHMHNMCLCIWFSPDPTARGCKTGFCSDEVDDSEVGGVA